MLGCGRSIFSHDGLLPRWRSRQAPVNRSQQKMLYISNAVCAFLMQVIPQISSPLRILRQSCVPHVHFAGLTYQYCLLTTTGGHRRSVSIYFGHHDSTRW